MYLNWRDFSVFHCFTWQWWQKRSVSEIISGAEHGSGSKTSRKLSKFKIQGCLYIGSEARFTSTVFVRMFLRMLYFLRRFGIHVNFVDICVLRKIFLKNFRKWNSRHIVVNLYEVLKKNLTKSTWIRPPECLYSTYAFIWRSWWSILSISVKIK